MIVCPHCGRQDRQIKAGAADGTQRYKCVACGRRYSLDTRPKSYASTLRDRAAGLHVTGMSIRKIARELGVSPQTISNWVRPTPSNAPTVVASLQTAPSSKPRTTITDVARHAGVSTTTVSNYLNDRGRISPATRQRIAEAMKVLYFTPNALVQAIRHGRTHTLGLMSYGIYELEKNVEFSTVAPILAAINRAADQTSYNILLYTGWPHRADTPTGSDFLNGQIDGLLWMSPQPYHPQLRFAVAGGLPVMAMLARRVPSGVGYVVADNIGGIHALVHYLSSRGHTRIGLLGSTDTSDFIDRATGYRQALRELGIPHDPEIEFTGVRVGEWSRASIEPVLDRWLQMPDRPTAIVAADDLLAAYAIDSIRERGMRVPEDMAITGFNDVPATEQLCGGITTVRQPFGEIGRIAVERLYALIHGAPLSECRVTVPVHVVIRGSTETQTPGP